jgi:GNAT superfamily N-acetyltransferase
MATPEDAAPIARVQVETWRSAYRGIVPDGHLASLSEEQRTDRWREILRTDDHTLVAEYDREVVGFASGGPIREPIESYDAELYAIYLLPGSQRRGIGRALVTELARRLDGKGLQRMAVWLFEANRAATHFYERLGAVRIGSKEREVGGLLLPLVAYGWPSLETILSGQRRDWGYDQPYGTEKNRDD